MQVDSAANTVQLGTAAQWAAVVIALGLGLFNFWKGQREEWYSFYEDNFKIRGSRRDFWKAIQIKEPTIDAMVEMAGPVPTAGPSIAHTVKHIEKLGSPAQQRLWALVNRVDQYRDGDDFDEDRATLSYFYERWGARLHYVRLAHLLGPHLNEMTLLTWFELARGYHSYPQAQDPPKPKLREAISAIEHLRDLGVMYRGPLKRSRQLQR